MFDFSFTPFFHVDGYVSAFSEYLYREHPHESYFTMKEYVGKQYIECKNLYCCFWFFAIVKLD